MMTLRGHTVIHYGHEDSEVECSEHVNVLSRQDYNRVYGEHDFRSKLFKFDQSDDAYTTFNTNAIREINLRKQPGDFLLAFWGSGHQNICQGAGEGMCVVEPGIGYPYGHFAEYKIFESYAMYHAFIKLDRVAQCVDINTWSKETVIPNYFDVNDFVDNVVPVKDRGDYFLFVGRIGSAKGVDHAIRMTERLGVRLIIAGQNADGGLKEVGMHPPPGHVEVIGHVDVNKRKTLMANAKAVVCMSTFAEPFCGVHVEAMMSGTPVITADWGAFTEFNVHGVTGFRCRTLDQMVDAGRRIHEIDPMACRKWAFDNFSTPVVAKKYEDFFDSIRPKHRIAVWMESSWALGRYARAMKKYLPDVDVYDWGNGDTNRHLWIDGHWKDYQTIISNTTLLRLKELYGIDVVPEDMSRRFLIISFFPKFEGTGYFQETLKNFPKNARYGGASLQICDVMRGLGVSNVKCIPFTADLEEFPVKHAVQCVKRLGIIGGPSRTNHPEYQDNKGIPMFDEICQKGGFEPVYIHGRTDDIYHDVDLLICCSKYEGAPTGIFEAAALGIPVLTRRVGCAQDVNGIALYDTVDEALSQLKYWNENLDVLKEYTRNITHEIRENWGLKTLIERHLKPTVYGLEYLMKKYGSRNYLQGCDKATLHSYAGTYDSLFQSLRDMPIRLLEIGVCSGGSLKVWEEYFTHPDSEFVGLDISKENIRYTFDDKRTKFLIQDATRDPPEGQFDIIIDDGSHALCDQLGALQLLASHLKPNGLYIIEDLQSMENANTILETSHDIKFELKDLRSVRGQYDDVLLIGRPTNSEPKLKVAIWGETIWAIGRIHRAIQKYLDCARVDMYDWSNGKSNNRLFTTAWKDYDRIVTKSDIFKLEEMFGLKLPDGILSKLVVISHCPDLDHLYFKEHIEIRDGPVYAGVSKETCEALRKKGVRAPIWVPFGADTEIFKNTHVFSPNEIKRIGMICVQGHNSEYNSVKRPDMFEEICQRVGATPVYICNRLTEDATLYSDIDLLISCSEFEAGPLGIFEAASCGVPVLTRPVGNAKYIEGIRTFNTADEAVDIIKSWNETSLCVYRDAITHEVHTNWSMKKCIRDYFEAAIFHRDTNKVAVWGEKNWAFGRIGNAIKKYVPNADLYDWSNCEDNTTLWVSGKWKNYNSIISNTSLLKLKTILGIEPDEDMLKRFVITAHCPRFDEMTYFTETLIGHEKKSRYCGVSQETCLNMKKRGVENAIYTPFGVDTDVFPCTHEVTGPIRRIGIIGTVGNIEEYNNVKGFDMFIDICQRGGFEPVYIFGRDEGKELYKDIDALICCSHLEGGPLGIFEAASCGVPVLTRRVGNVQYIKGIAMFETADEALNILDIWNGNVDALREYANDVTNEVRVNWSMCTLIHKHLMPVLNNSQILDCI